MFNILKRTTPVVFALLLPFSIACESFAAAPRKVEICRPKPLGLTVTQALKKYGPQARDRIVGRFSRVQAPYPPKRTTWVCLKDERQLLVFARNARGDWKQIASYPLVSWSGVIGPKLKEGDLQMPEGFYKPTGLDAFTHLSLWVNYPNASDRRNARLEHRTALGGSIQIHEGVYSTGCAVIDHDAMSELFVLAHDVGCEKIDLIFAPCNLAAKTPLVDFSRQPKWLPHLYKDLKAALAALPMGGPS
ncbi:MAG: hypothetical protein JSS83_15500 [Cyanobacteria bacterium SZAS LIN-3]|nr:hypothetical protein [Cyanobacteria bacterium SZAS LIN-3]